MDRFLIIRAGFNDGTLYAEVKPSNSVAGSTIIDHIKIRMPFPFSIQKMVTNTAEANPQLSERKVKEIYAMTLEDILEHHAPCYIVFDDRAVYCRRLNAGEYFSKGPTVRSEDAYGHVQYIPAESVVEIRNATLLPQ